VLAELDFSKVQFLSNLLVSRGWCQAWALPFILAKWRRERRVSVEPQAIFSNRFNLKEKKAVR
jgi:hypothetical protein